MGQTRSSVAALPPHYVASLAPLLSSYVRSYLKEDKGLSLIFLESQDRYVGGCYLTFLSYEIHEKEGFQTQKEKGSIHQRLWKGLPFLMISKILSTNQKIDCEYGYKQGLRASRRRSHEMEYEPVLQTSLILTTGSKNLGRRPPLFIEVFFEVHEKILSVIHYRSRRTPKNEIHKVSTERRERLIQIFQRSEGTRLIRRGAKVLVEKNIGEDQRRGMKWLD